MSEKQGQRWKGLRFTNPMVRYIDGKRVGKWNNGNRRNPSRKHGGKKKKTVTVKA